MNYMLDTDTLIYFLKGNESVVKSFAKTPLELLHTSIINHAELHFGAHNSAHKKNNLDLIERFLKKMTLLPFCQKSSCIFAEQKAILKKKGQIIADMDLMIASISVANHMTLVTNNVRHFDRIKDLKIANWT